MVAWEWLFLWRKLGPLIWAMISWNNKVWEEMLLGSKSSLFVDSPTIFCSKVNPCMSNVRFLIWIRRIHVRNPHIRTTPRNLVDYYSLLPHSLRLLSTHSVVFYHEYWNENTISFCLVWVYDSHYFHWDGGSLLYLSHSSTIAGNVKKKGY